jgi:hypothetical protein
MVLGPYLPHNLFLHITYPRIVINDEQSILDPSPLFINITCLVYAENVYDVFIPIYSI